MPSPSTTPGRPPAKGALFPHQVVADNLRALRTPAGLSQTDVAQRMVALGHATWSKALVSQFENHNRGLALSEFLALALVLEVSPMDLLDTSGMGVDLDLEGPGVLTAEMTQFWFSGNYLPLRWNGNHHESPLLDHPKAARRKPTGREAAKGKAEALRRYGPKRGSDK